MTKYIKSDISNGLSYLKAGICNIITGTVNKELNNYILELPVTVETLQNLIKVFIPDAIISYNYTRLYKEDSIPSFYILINDKLLEVFHENNNFKFILVR